MCELFVSIFIFEVLLSYISIPPHCNQCSISYYLLLVI